MADLIPYLVTSSPREAPLHSHLDRVKGLSYLVLLSPVFGACLNFPSTFHFVDLAYHHFLVFVFQYLPPISTRLGHS